MPDRLAIICPEGVEAGQLLEVEAPSGGLIQVIVPDGVAAGDEFEVDLPRDEQEQEQDEEEAGGAAGATVEAADTDSIDLEYLLASGGSSSSSSSSEAEGEDGEEEEDEAAHLAALDQEFASFAAGALAEETKRQARFAELEAARARAVLIDARATDSARQVAASADADDGEFEKRLAYTFSQMDSNKTNAVNFMQLRKWISAQMKADQELSVSEITDEMQKASTDAFAKYKRYDDMLGKEEVAELLRELDLLKYMTEVAPEPEPEVEKAQSRLVVICPEGVEPGQLIEVEGPSGGLIQLTVPNGVAAGDEFEVDLADGEEDRDEREDTRADEQQQEEGSADVTETAETTAALDARRASAAAALQAAARGWLTRERMLSMGFDSDEQLDESREDETSTRVQFLAAVPLMAAMTAEELKRIAATMVSEHYEDEYILEEGDTGASMYIVKQGIGVAEKGGFEVSRFQRGDHFGERALITGGPRTATVRADGAVECLRLGRGPFLELMSQCTHVASLFAQQEQVYEETNQEIEKAQSRLVVICPEGVEPGQLIEVEGPSGGLIQLTVPNGVAAGDEFEVDLADGEEDGDEREDTRADEQQQEEGSADVTETTAALDLVLDVEVGAADEGEETEETEQVVGDRENEQQEEADEQDEEERERLQKENGRASLLDRVDEALDPNCTDLSSIHFLLTDIQAANFRHASVASLEMKCAVLEKKSIANGAPQQSVALTSDTENRCQDDSTVRPIDATSSHTKEKKLSRPKRKSRQDVASAVGKSENSKRAIEAARDVQKDRDVRKPKKRKDHGLVPQKDAVLLSPTHASRIDRLLDPNCEDLDQIKRLLEEIKGTEFRQVCARSSKFKSAGFGQLSASDDQPGHQGVAREMIARVSRCGVCNEKLAVVQQRLKAHSYGTSGQDPMKAFKHFDKDNSGALDFDEFRAAVRKVGHMTTEAISDDDLRALFESLDADESGDVQLDEMTSFIWGSFSFVEDESEVASASRSPKGRAPRTIRKTTPNSGHEPSANGVTAWQQPDGQNETEHGHDYDGQLLRQQAARWQAEASALDSASKSEQDGLQLVDDLASDFTKAHISTLAWADHYDSLAPEPESVSEAVPPPSPRQPGAPTRLSIVARSTRSRDSPRKIAPRPPNTQDQGAAPFGFKVICPADVYAGQQLLINTSDGCQLEVTVPDGVEPGNSFIAALPTADLQGIGSHPYQQHERQSSRRELTAHSRQKTRANSAKEPPGVATVRKKLSALSYGAGGEDPVKLFSHFDRDNSGTLDFGEFRSAIRRGAQITVAKMSDAELRKVFNAVDSDDGGDVSLVELTEFIWGPIDAGRIQQIERDQQTRQRQQRQRKLGCASLDAGFLKPTPSFERKVQSRPSTTQGEKAVDGMPRFNLVALHVSTDDTPGVGSYDLVRADVDSIAARAHAAKVAGQRRASQKPSSPRICREEADGRPVGLAHTTGLAGKKPLITGRCTFNA
eukprot:COSAG03_NODE_142_length_11687_cov_11.710131_9_plen_1477_part_00